MTRTRTVITAFTLVSVLALGACSDDDPEPKFAPTSSPSTSAPTSPSTTGASGPTEPTMPAEAMGTTPEAAAEFVQFYWNVATYAQVTGDVEELRELSSETCIACVAGIDAIASVYRKGGSLSGGGTLVRPIETAEIAGGDRKAVRVVARLTNQRQQLDLPGSSDDKTYPKSTVTTEFIVESRAGSWVLSYWDTKS